MCLIAFHMKYSSNYHPPREIRLNLYPILTSKAKIDKIQKFEATTSTLCGIKIKRSKKRKITNMGKFKLIRFSERDFF